MRCIALRCIALRYVAFVVRSFASFVRSLRSLRFVVPSFVRSLFTKNPKSKIQNPKSKTQAGVPSTATVSD